MFYVYIIESEIDNSWYYGYSKDPYKRLLYHNEGESIYTKRKLPWGLIFIRSFEIKGEALNFEKYLKKTRNKAYIKREFREFFI